MCDQGERCPAGRQRLQVTWPRYGGPRLPLGEWALDGGSCGRRRRNGGSAISRYADPGGPRKFAVHRAIEDVCLEDSPCSPASGGSTSFVSLFNTARAHYVHLYDPPQFYGACYQGSNDKGTGLVSTATQIAEPSPRCRGLVSMKVALATGQVSSGYSARLVHHPAWVGLRLAPRCAAEAAQQGGGIISSELRPAPGQLQRDSWRGRRLHGCWLASTAHGCCRGPLAKPQASQHQNGILSRCWLQLQSGRHANRCLRIQSTVRVGEDLPR